jgi:hypothetical protein
MEETRTGNGIGSCPQPARIKRPGKPAQDVVVPQQLTKLTKLAQLALSAHVSDHRKRRASPLSSRRSLPRRRLPDSQPIQLLPASLPAHLGRLSSN